MEKKTIIKLVMTVVLAVYLVVAMSMTRSRSLSDVYGGLDIVVADSLNTRFVSAADISRECGGLTSRIDSVVRGSLDINDLERRLARMPEIERANVAELNNGRLLVEVTPMIPIARVFEPSGRSYYINTEGKRVAADVRYHVDVPVVVGRFDAGEPASRLLPILRYVASDPTLNALVSTVTTDSRGDIFVVPVIRGHVVNLGDTSLIANKFDRLKVFYREVMPVKGWNFYDTVSVKWRGQIVASRREKKLGDIALDTRESEFDFIDDVETMSPENEGFADETVPSPNDKKKS